MIESFGVDTFVETGIGQGTTFVAVQGWFCQLYKECFLHQKPLPNGVTPHIHEVDNNLDVVARFVFYESQNFQGAHIYRADSAQWLKYTIDNQLFHPYSTVLFYLDAHCAALTSKGEIPSPNPQPLIQELEQVLRLTNPIICIDDWERIGHTQNNLEAIRGTIKGHVNYIYKFKYPTIQGVDSVLLFPGWDEDEVRHRLMDIEVLEVAI